MNKRTKILGISAVVILSTAIGYRVYSGNAAKRFVSNNNVSEPVRASNPVHESKPVVRVPEKGRIAQSIDNLARQIVENAPNQEEAYSFLVEAKSYRIQELRARRAKDKAEEAKSLYDAELWNKKLGQIGVELSKESEKQAVDTQAGSLATGVFRESAIISDKARPTPIKMDKEITLAEFSLRAIIKDGDHYVARLSYGRRNMPAKEGYTLLGKVDVKQISSDQVVLQQGKDEVTLYAY